jgi:hypothetical protein
MIRDIEFFHGAALARLVRSSRGITISLFKKRNNASYLINGCCGLYLKHSSSRMSPWSFTFQRDHQHYIDEMYRLVGYVVVGLICNDDGVVGLDYNELRSVLDDNYEAVEGLGISRKPRGMYLVKGHDGKMNYRIGKGDFVKKVLAQKCPLSRS